VNKLEVTIYLLFLRFFYYISELFRQCGIFLLYFGTVPTVWDISELFRQCGIFLLYFGTVPTVWYFSIIFRNCSECGIFLLYFGTVPSVVFFYYISELFRVWYFCFSFYMIYIKKLEVINIFYQITSLK
jgi:hypothetical protein